MTSVDSLEGLHAARRVLDQAVRSESTGRLLSSGDIDEYAGSLVVTVFLLRELVTELEGRLQGLAETSTSHDRVDRVCREIGRALESAGARTQELHVLVGAMIGKPPSRKVASWSDDDPQASRSPIG